MKGVYYVAIPETLINRKEYVISLTQAYFIIISLHPITKEFTELKPKVPIKSRLEDIFIDFVKGRFTKSQLLKMCEKRGIDIDGNKEVAIEKVIKLYSPEELAEESRIIEFLRWHEKLIISILLSVPKSMREIVEHKLVKSVFSRGVPESAFGIITSKILNQRESNRYFSRKINGLKKKHILLAEKRGKSFIYSIHPWFHPYFEKKIPLPKEDEIIRQIREEVRGNVKSFLTYGFEDIISTLSPIFWKTWKDSLKKFEDIISEVAKKTKKGDSNLRFGLPAVAASSIAKQYYCEKKVELTQKHGREETLEMRLGIEAHERLLEDTIKAKRIKVWKQIAYGVPITAREMPLVGRYKDVILVGMTDGIYFAGGAPKLLLEYKFTKNQRPYRDHHIQARVYCLLLHLMGFDTERLKYALIMASPGYKGSKRLRDIVKTILSNPGKDIVEVKANEVTARIYVADFEMNQTMQEVEWATGYWKKEREAIPTKKAEKCAICEFKQTCPDSLAKRSNCGLK